MSNVWRYILIKKKEIICYKVTFCTWPLIVSISCLNMSAEISRYIFHFNRQSQSQHQFRVQIVYWLWADIEHLNRTTICTRWKIHSEKSPAVSQNPNSPQKTRSTVAQARKPFRWLWFKKNVAQWSMGKGFNRSVSYRGGQKRGRMRSYQMGSGRQRLLPEASTAETTELRRTPWSILQTLSAAK